MVNIVGSGFANLLCVGGGGCLDLFGLHCGRGAHVDVLPRRNGVGVMGDGVVGLRAEALYRCCSLRGWAMRPPQSPAVLTACPHVLTARPFGWNAGVVACR